MDVVTDRIWLDKCRQKCKAIKTLAEPMDWAERPNHSRAYRANASLLDASGVAIPGLYVQFEYQSRRYGEYAQYALFYKSDGSIFRVLMIEAIPAHKRSHVEDNLEIYGSHILLGDHRAGSHRVRAVKSSLVISDHIRWLSRFRRHARIRAGVHDLTPVSGPLFVMSAAG
jgi:hypothetical protein